ncbi:hypothetical protein [Bartonella choladocola]|uniref:hypothetical protein n=1 Tax=Bartonella choladocola TaxID=2750995 RepID=UPI00122DDF34|nr:hypothetical protein [Bartonella choladocola]
MTGFKRQKLTDISCLANSRFCNFTFFGGLAGVTSFWGRGLAVTGFSLSPDFYDKFTAREFAFIIFNSLASY